MKIAGWMPLKKHSTRLPGKNWRSLTGKPLFWHMLETMNSACPDGVWINTDNESIGRDYLGRDAPNCRLITRKAEHRDPTMSTVEMLVDDLDRINADIVVYCHATIPLLRWQTLNDAVIKFSEVYPRYDSVISVTRMQERFFDDVWRPDNFHPGIVLPLQDMPPRYIENSAFFILHSDTLRHLRRRVGDRPYLYEIDANEAVEIDDENDWQYAEWLYWKAHSNGRNGNRRQYLAVNACETVDLETLSDAVMNAGRIIE